MLPFNALKTVSRVHVKWSNLKPVDCFFPIIPQIWKIWRSFLWDGSWVGNVCCTIVTTKTHATVLFVLVLIMLNNQHMATTAYISLPKTNLLLRDLSSSTSLAKKPRLCHTFRRLRGFSYLEDPISKNGSGGISVDLLNPGCFIDPIIWETFAIQIHSK